MGSKRNISERFQADRSTQVNPSTERLIKQYFSEGHAERYEKRFAKKTPKTKSRTNK